MPDIVLRTAKRLWSKGSLNHLPVTTEKNIFQSPYNLPEFSTVESQYIFNFPDAASDQTASLRIRSLFRGLPQCPVVETPPSNAGGMGSNELGFHILHRKKERKKAFLSKDLQKVAIQYSTVVGKSKALESDVRNSLSKEHHLSKLQFLICKMRIISPIPLNPYRTEVGTV